MRKSIAILTAAVMTFCLAAPAFAAEDTITTKRNGEEIVLTAAEDTDKTKEEVEAMAKEAADKMDTYTFSMVMNMDVNISAKTEMGDMSIDMVMNIDALDNKNVDKEYKIQKTTGEMFGTEMNSEEEEYIFKNSSGKKVSVKKTRKMQRKAIPRQRRQKMWRTIWKRKWIPRTPSAMWPPMRCLTHSSCLTRCIPTEPTSIMFLREKLVKSLTAVSVMSPIPSEKSNPIRTATCCFVKTAGLTASIWI